MKKLALGLVLILSLSLLAGCGGGGNEEAEVETVDLIEEFRAQETATDYEGLKIKVNGSLVGFNDTFGYPWVEEVSQVVRIPYQPLLVALNATDLILMPSKMTFNMMEHAVEIPYDQKQHSIDQTPKVKFGSPIIALHEAEGSDRYFFSPNFLKESFDMNLYWNAEEGAVEITTEELDLPVIFAEAARADLAAFEMAFEVK
jgi:hypothetical protein